MRYKIFLSDSIEVLSNEQFIAEANDIQDLLRAAWDYLDENEIDRDVYCRFVLGANVTFIDFGSWSKFLAIIPPISTKDIS